jgi:hypothetical protein
MRLLHIHAFMLAKKSEDPLEFVRKTCHYFLHEEESKKIE